MTDEEKSLLEEQLKKAETPEARLEVWLLWWPHMARCLASTNRHVKSAETSLGNINAGLNALVDKVNKLHAKAKWKDGKLEWLKENWMWVVVFLYMIQSLRLEGMFGDFFSLIGG